MSNFGCVKSALLYNKQHYYARVTTYIMQPQYIYVLTFVEIQ